MSEGDGSNDGFDDLPFHEFCAQCNQRFDGTVLNPTVAIVEREELHVPHSFADGNCLRE